MNIGDYIEFYGAPEELNPKGAKIIAIRDYDGAYFQYFNAFVTLRYNRRDKNDAETELPVKIDRKPHKTTRL